MKEICAALKIYNPSALYVNNIHVLPSKALKVPVVMINALVSVYTFSWAWVQIHKVSRVGVVI